MKKVFTFGDGQVLVSKCWLNGYVKLTQIKPPLGYVGVLKTEDENKYEELYELKLTKKEDELLLKELKATLSSLKESTILEYEHFILDFTNFNLKSVSIFCNAIDVALRGHSQLALAC